VGRAGILPLITGNGDWWERPFDFFVAGGLGVILPYRIGVEVNYEYASVLKSYESSDLDFRISSGKFGARLSIGFELSREKIYNPHDRIEKRDESAAQEEPFDDDSDDSETIPSKDSAQTPEVAPSEPVADSTKAAEPVQPVEAEPPAAVSAENEPAEISSKEPTETEPATVQAKNVKGKKKTSKKSTPKKKASAKTKAKKSKKK
jgi:hypothetical protein